MSMTAPAPDQAPTSTGATILVVDDEDAVAELVTSTLERAGHRVARVGTGPDALAHIARQRPDLVVLDLMLPGLGGLEVLREVRRTNRVPVILLSAIADVGERVVGLELGADDYVTKPFSPRELAARVRSVLRRTTPAVEQQVVDLDGLCVDGRARQVTVDGDLVPLTTREFDLLAFLAAAPGEAFSREQLLRRVWASTSEWQDPATVTEHVRRVRLKTEVGLAPRRRIVTVRGVGYRFEP
jgi:DNA-binding response OmpR family regulator